MTKQEVTRFITYIQDLYNMPGIETQEAYEDWCEAFANVTFEQGKRIVAQFGKENTDRPTLPILIKYRDALFPPTADKPASCIVCNGTGTVLVEKRIVMNPRNPNDDLITIFAYQCTCPNGKRFYPTLPLISREIIKNKHRDISGIWRVEEPAEQFKWGAKRPVDKKEVIQLMKDTAKSW